MHERNSEEIAIVRRHLVHLVGAGLVVGVAGCTDRAGDGGRDDGSRPPMAVTEASVSETTITTDERLEVRATIENRGEREGTFHAELRMDDVIVDTEAVTVAADEAETATFSGTFAAPGEYEVSVNGEPAGTVVVELPPPEFEVREAAIDRTTVAIGEGIEVTATIANVGGRAGSFTAELRVDGLSVETKEVTIDAGAEEPVSFAHDFNGPGEYEVSVNEVALDTVRVAPPAAFEIVATAVDRTTIEVGERVEVRATVTNVGNLEGTTAVELKRDGEAIEAREVTLAPAETTEIRFPVDFEEPGAYDLSVTSTGSGSGDGVGVETVYVRECSIVVSETVTVESRSSEVYAFDLEENAEITIGTSTREGVDPTLTVVGPSGDPLVEETSDSAIRRTATTREAGRHEVRLANDAFLPWRSGTWAVEIELCRW